MVTIGYGHEILHVQECLRAGRTESPLWSHADTLGLLTLMTRIREAAGLPVPQARSADAA